MGCVLPETHSITSDACPKKDAHTGSLSKAQKTAERRQQKQKRKLNEGKLVEKRHQMDKAKV
jgi:hypothetical protein